MLRLVGFPRRIARALSITLILFPLAMAAAPSSLAQEFNARLTFMDGTAIDGRVVSLGEQACLVRVSNGDAQEFAVEDIARIAVLDEATLSPPPQIEVRCVDGSTLMAREATAQGGTLKLTGGSATVVVACVSFSTSAFCHARMSVFRKSISSKDYLII